MRFAGELCALGTAVCWSISGNLFTAAGRRMGSVTLNRLRITTAAVMLGMTLWITRGAPWPGWATKPQVLFLAASGIVGFTFGDRFGFRSMVILGASRGAMLGSLAPVFTTLLGLPLLGEHPGPLAMLGTALTVGGVMWTLSQFGASAHDGTEGSVLVGVGCGVLGAMGQAGGYVLSKLAMRDGLDPLSATVIRAVVATAGVWVMAAFEGGGRASLAALRDRRATLLMVGGSALGPFLGVTLSLAALQFVPAGVAASITAFYPVLTILVAARFWGERITWKVLAGATVAAAGVVVLFLR